ncbi:MAG: DUF6045 family protein [Clostridiales Family XIII bacterium]|nr:DUF6045 family protein [Clostridiales Family XIII bacterium]
MLDWLGNLFQGMGEAIAEAMALLMRQVSVEIWDIMLRWLYTAIYTAISDFFTEMGNLGVGIFDLSWVAAALGLFKLLAFALFCVGLACAIFDVAVEYQTGRVNIKTTSLNILKGYLAANLITTVPIELYKFCITLQNVFAGDLTVIFVGEQALSVGEKSLSVLEGTFYVTETIQISVFNLLAMIALAYCVIKIFFDNIKRGGILIIQIAVGSLYMFSVPRGYSDGFTQWIKQVIALCLTAFLQTTLLYLGLMTFSQHMLLGLGIMMSASEVPRIAQQFGLDTSVKFNVMSIVHTTSMAVNLTRNITRAVAR